MNNPKKSNSNFNFTSHNTQGYRPELQTKALSQLHSGQTDLVAFQESGQLPFDFKSVRGTPNLYSGEISGSNKSHGTRLSTQKPAHGLFYEFKGKKGKNARTSMAMFSREKPISSGVIKSREKGVRPMMFMQFKNLTVTNLHLPSGKSKFAAKVLHGFLEDLDAQIGQQKRKKNGLLMLGDLNMDADRAAKTANAHQFSVFSPPTATHQGGNTLDHVLTRLGKVEKMNIEFSSSDHSSVSGTYSHK